MYKNIQNILIVIAVVVIIDKLFSYAFMKFIFRHTLSGQSGGTINYVIDKRKSLDFIILGSSRARNSLDPSLLKSLGNDGYNLGINGSTALNNLLVFDILIRNHATPKTLVLQADLFELGKDDTEETVEQLKRVYPYDTPLIRHYVSQVGLVERIKYSFDLYKLNRKIINIGFNYFKKDPSLDLSGYVGLPVSEERLDEHTTAEKYVYEPNSVNSDALRKIKELADSNNIRTVVVFPPTYKNVGYNKEEQDRLVQDMRRNGFTTILDFSDIDGFPELQSPENWRDSFHLSSRGAEQFSKEVDDKISRLKSW